ncbi:MAG TPA: Hsp20/alpha crystallin family protein [Dehalococcoidia bacterium]|nr:Hsp20/alpha crystallin family protein [Dehalococcoidia bacterium]
MSLIVRRQPRFNREFTGIRHAMDRFFDDSPFSAQRFAAPRSRLTNADAVATLPIDISEVDGDTTVRASVPGFSAEEIEVTVEDGVLTISARHEDASEESDEHYYRRERRTGSVSRRISLPRNTPDVEVAAELADGVLTLTIPTPEEQKQIEIKSSN